MDSIYVKVSSVTPHYIESNLETLLTINTFNTCDTENIKLKVFLDRDMTSGPLFKIYLNVNSYEIVDASVVPEIANYCIWPVIVVENTVVAGLCSVSRQIIKSSLNKDVQHLLGFRKACLLSCSESSIWTRFCEVDMIRTVNDTYNRIAEANKVNHEESDVEEELPEDLTRFEYHMEQPVRMHNVYKLARVKHKDKDIKSSVQLKDLNIPHCYSEGPYISLADALLNPCISLLIDIYTEEVFRTELPLTYEWFKNMQSQNLPQLKFEPCVKVQFSKGKKLLQKIVVRQSLYSSDPNRYKPQSRIYTKQNNIEHSLDLVNESGLKIINGLPYGHDVDFNWKDLPLEVNPEGGALPKSRAHRKCEQLENLTKAVLKIATRKTYTIVDFCSGSGHLGLVLAVLLPNCRILLVENKERSLIRAKERVNSLDLQNVVLLQCNLDYFKGKFDVGVSLHACGVATDLVIQNCISNRAHFVSCPCCYGGIYDCYHLKYPRSECYRSFITYGDYLHLAHAADQTHDEENVKTKQGYACMDVIDTDRKLYAEKCGYEVFLGKLVPSSCTPKNNLLVGIFK